MNRFFTTDKVYNERLDICKSCIYYFKLTGQCKRCLCFMKIKARLSTQNCPQKYWTKTTSVQAPDYIPEEMIQAVIEIYPDIKNGRAKNQEVKKRMIELYNTIYNTNYDQGTNCSSCLNSCLNGIKDIYNLYKD